MKQLFSLVCVMFAIAISAQTKAVNAANSKIDWKGYKVTGSHTGTVGVKSGALIFSGDVLKGGEVVIDMTTMACTDLDAKTGGGLVGHLSSDEFFGVAKNPTAKIAITKVASKGKPGEYKITANLTIKNITKEIKFDANVGTNMAKAALKIDRTDYDVKYGSGSFMDNLGDKTIYDEFDLNVTLGF